MHDERTIETARATAHPADAHARTTARVRASVLVDTRGPARPTSYLSLYGRR